MKYWILIIFRNAIIIIITIFTFSCSFGGRCSCCSWPSIINIVVDPNIAELVYIESSIVVIRFYVSLSNHKTDLPLKILRFFHFSCEYFTIIMQITQCYYLVQCTTPPLYTTS